MRTQFCKLLKYLSMLTLMLFLYSCLSSKSLTEVPMNNVNGMNESTIVVIHYGYDEFNLFDAKLENGIIKGKKGEDYQQSKSDDVYKELHIYVSKYRKSQNNEVTISVENIEQTRVYKFNEKAVIINVLGVFAILYLILT